MSNASVSDVTNGKKYTFTYTALANKNGTVTFTLPASTVKDNANNYAATKTSNAVTVDTTKPTCTITEAACTSGNLLLTLT